MEQIKQVISQMISISEVEMAGFLKFCTVKTFKKHEPLSKCGSFIHELFFINTGIARVTILDQSGTEHTTHFALENHFIADYASFILQQPSFYTLEALETTQVTVPGGSTGRRTATLRGRCAGRRPRSRSQWLRATGQYENEHVPDACPDRCSDLTGTGAKNDRAARTAD